MSAYAHVSLIDGYLDAVADVVCGPGLLDLEEIGIFPEAPPPQSSRSVKSALQYDGKHLGLASWSLNALYIEGKKRICQNKNDFRAASAMLLAAPEYTTAWNIRKLELTPDGVSNELLFSKLLLLRSPKSAETWAHRSWVLNRYGCSAEQIPKELDVSTTAASRAPNNYYAGVHRLRIISTAHPKTILTELEKSRKWLRTHVSDSSGWWYHRLLVRRHTSTDLSVLSKEQAYSSELFSRYKDTHQNVCIHWKWLQNLQDDLKTFREKAP